MKSSAQDSPAWNGTNSSGFSGLDGGVRYIDGTFIDGGVSCFVWSATATTSGLFASYRKLSSSNSLVGSANGQRELGLSVRCVRDKNAGLWGA